MANEMVDERIDPAYDVVVVGGGAAGLSAALALGRARRTVLVVDAGAPRNAPAGHVHNYLAREGVAPADLLAAGRAEVAGYGARVVTGSVASAERLDGSTDEAANGARFRALLADGRSVRARRLLVTTGLVDELPDVPGLAQRWGRDVLHCPYCHGWEVRDQPIGILGTSPMAVEQALMWRQWSADLTLFLHTAPAPSDEQREQLAARGITVVEGEVGAVEVVDDQLSGVRLRSGDVIPLRAVVVAPRFRARADVLTSLGVEATDMQFGDHVIGSLVPADPAGATAVPGVWVAGNVTDLRAQVISSAAAGLNTAAAINTDLIAEDTAHAVAAHRTTGGAAQFWDGFYREHGRHGPHGSGKANPVLVDVVGDLPAGTALDLGSGEGSDALWLARAGWQVTAVDVSATALERATERAATAAVDDRIDWQQHDLARSFPTGSFDLVSAQYLHSPVDFPREQVLQAAASAVAPGGLLLIVGHADVPPWADNPCPHTDVHLPSPDEVLASLRLAPGQWHTERLDSPARQANGPDGQTATLTDSVVALRRLAA